MTSAKSFVVRIGGQQLGPLTAPELRSLAAQGSLNGPFQVSIDGQPWQHATIEGGQLHLLPTVQPILNAPAVAVAGSRQPPCMPVVPLRASETPHLPPSTVGSEGVSSSGAVACEQVTGLTGLWQEYKILICGGAIITAMLVIGAISWGLNTPAEVASRPEGGSTGPEQPVPVGTAKSPADRVVAALYPDSSVRPDERGYAGFAFGEARASIKSRVEPLPCLYEGIAKCSRCGVARGDSGSKACSKQPIENSSLASKWADVASDIALLLEEDRIVGVARYYDFPPKDSFKALFDRFGEPPQASITELEPIRVQMGTSTTFTNETIVIRYCFQKAFVSASVWHDSGHGLRDRGLRVFAFDRDYLEPLMRRDVAMKEAILVSLLPAIRHALGPNVSWDKIPFPKIDGTSQDNGSLQFTIETSFKYAALRGRETERAHAYGNDAVFIREEKKLTGDEYRSVGTSVTVHFDSFPAYPHPLPPALESLSHEVTLANLHLCRVLFPGQDGKIESKTAADHRGAYRSYAWTTSDQWNVRVEGNNTIVLSRIDRPRLD